MKNNIPKRSGWVADSTPSLARVLGYVITFFFILALAMSLGQNE